MPNIRINDVYKQILNHNMHLLASVRYFIIYGGRRSGKSFDITQILDITARTQPDHFIPIIRKVASTIKDSVFSEHQRFFNRNLIYTNINKTEKEISLPNGSRIRGFGLDDEMKLRSLTGADIIHIEEANEITEEDFDSIDAGLSPARYPAHIVMTFNPIPQIQGSQHWIQRRFLQHDHELSKACIFDTPTGKACVLRTWYKDNAFCPEATKKVLEGYKETNPQKYKLWALGEFTEMLGAVFHNIDIVKKVPIGIDCLGIGLDFGFSNDPSTAVKVWKLEATKEIWIQQLFYSTGLFPDTIFAKMKEAGVSGSDEITADSARPDIIDDLYRRGLAGIVGVKKHTGYKEEAANQLQAYKIHIVEGSTDCIREFSTLCWARDKNEHPLPKLQDGDDHTTDCLIMVWSAHQKELSILDVV